MTARALGSDQVSEQVTRVAPRRSEDCPTPRDTRAWREHSLFTGGIRHFASPDEAVAFAAMLASATRRLRDEAVSGLIEEGRSVKEVAELTGLPAKQIRDDAAPPTSPAGSSSTRPA
jgi:hypothetical protein